VSLMMASRNPPQAVNAAQTKPRRAVAVMGFKNLSGRQESAWLSPALSETLTMELGTGGTLRAIPGESVARMKIDLAVADIDSFAQDTLSRIRRNIGADVLILGIACVVAAVADGQFHWKVASFWVLELKMWNQEPCAVLSQASSEVPRLNAVKAWTSGLFSVRCTKLYLTKA